MSLPGPVLLAIGALSCGTIIGWTSVTMRDNAVGGTSEERTGSGIASASLVPGKLDPAKSGSARRIKGVLGEDPSAGPRKISAASPEFARAVHAAAAIKNWTDREVRLREIMRSIPAEDLPAAFESAKKFTRSDSDMVLSALGSRWAEADPHAAAEFAVKVGNFGENDYNALLAGVIDKWSSAAPLEAASWAEALPPGLSRRNALWSAISEEAKKDPQEALQIAGRQTLSGMANNYADIVFNAWASRDLEAAANAATQLKGQMAQGALQAVARSWSQEDPAKAMAWASTISDLATRKRLISSVADQWAESDPQSELGWAHSLTDQSMRREAMTKGIVALAGTDVSAALEQLHAMPAGKDRDDAIRAAALKIAGTDARRAAELVDQLPTGPARNQSIARLCTIWGESDPRAALDWFVQNAGSAGSGGWGIGQAVQGWASNAPDEAIAWAKALPPGDNRDTAMASIVSGLTATDFERAQALFNEISPEAQKSAATSLAYTLLQEDTGKARAWVESLPPGPPQNNALGAVAWQWASQDPTATAQWLGTLPPGKGLDNALSSFSNVTFDRDPEGSLAWALTIGDPKNRDKATEDLVTRWLHSDSTAARAWLDANQQITPEEKDRILHRN